jgi:hypothetical protein
VRRVSPEGSGTGTQLILARAEALLKDENLSTALSELKSLQGQAANAASPWIEDAEHVRHAHDIVDRLLAYVTQKMVQESGLVGEQQ